MLGHLKAQTGLAPCPFPGCSALPDMTTIALSNHLLEHHEVYLSSGAWRPDTETFDEADAPGVNLNHLKKGKKRQSKQADDGSFTPLGLSDEDKVQRYQAQSILGQSRW